MQVNALSRALDSSSRWHKARKTMITFFFSSGGLLPSCLFCPWGRFSLVSQERAEHNKSCRTSGMKSCKI